MGSRGTRGASPTTTVSQSFRLFDATRTDVQSLVFAKVGDRFEIGPGRRSSTQLALLRFGVAVTVLLLVSHANARTLSDVFSDPRFAGLELKPVGPALANTVAGTYPVASASASVVYAYNPDLGTFERQTGVGGPIFGERAETIGRGQLDVGLSYSFVHLARINGDDLGQLLNRPVVNGRLIAVQQTPPVTLKDGRVTNFLPVRVVADIDVDADITTPQLTYGLTPDLDVNVTLPLLFTSLALSARTQTPDPRLPQFALPSGERPNNTPDAPSSDASAAGVGDILLRAKYVLLRNRPVDVAASLRLSLPTGDTQNFQGAGHTTIEPMLVLSRVFAGRFEPLLNLGVAINAADPGRSVFTWAAGGTFQWRELTTAVVFLGRNEFAAQTDKIPDPFFFQIERNNIYDASVGFRYRFAEGAIVSANALVPLNQQGLRADVIPTVEMEYVF